MRNELTSYGELARIHEARSREQLEEISRLEQAMIDQRQAYKDDLARLRSGARCPRCDELRLELGEARGEIGRLRLELEREYIEVANRAHCESELQKEIERLGKELADLNAGWQRTYDHDTNMLKASIAEQSRDLAKIEGVLEQEKQEHNICTTLHALAVKERNYERTLAMAKDTEIERLRRQVDEAAIHVPAHAAIEIWRLRGLLREHLDGPDAAMTWRETHEWHEDYLKRIEEALGHE